MPGIEPGAHLLVEGMIGERGRRLAMVNPAYTILQDPEVADGRTSRVNGGAGWD